MANTNEKLKEDRIIKAILREVVGSIATYKGHELKNGRLVLKYNFEVVGDKSDLYNLDDEINRLELNALQIIQYAARSENIEVIK